MKIIFTFLVLITSLISCKTITEAKVAPGRCRINEDCTVGLACKNTFCEDIYYPTKQIQQY